MKTTDPKDPLDQTIDRLLRRRTVQPRPDLVDVVMDATQREPRGALAKGLLRFALPVAAAIAVAFAVYALQSPDSIDSGSATVVTENALTFAEVEEILELEAGLGGFAYFAETEPTDTELLEVLVSDYSS